MCLFVLTSTTAAQPLPTSGPLKGTNLDWPKGKAGEVRLVFGLNEFTKGIVDTQGNFSLNLPNLKDIQFALIPITDILPGDPTGACRRKGTAIPTTAHGNSFQLDVYQNGKRLGDIALNSTAQIPPPSGSHQTALVFYDAAATLKGSVTCEHYVQQYDGRFSAKWSLELVEFRGLNQAGLNQIKSSGNRLPKNLAWRIYREHGGGGFDFEVDRLRDQGAFVTKVTPGVPAEKAGLKFGDVIVEVNGQPVKGLSNRALRERLQGKPGTKVTIGVQSGVKKSLRHLTFTRVLIRED